MEDRKQHDEAVPPPAGTAVNRSQLLRRFLPGLLPIVVFILADEIWGTRVGLAVAVAYGIGQLAVIAVRERRLDRFTLLDTTLIVALGAMSIALDNDLFFKLKPGFVGVILCAALGLSAFTRFDVLGAMAQRYTQGATMGDEQALLFRRNVRILFFVFSAHTLLVFYAAVFLPKEAWAFISTALFYILFGAFFAYSLVEARLRARRMRGEEWLLLVDEEGRVIGRAPRSACHRDKRLLHPVVHLHLIRDGRSIFLQKRPMTKLVQPGKWDTAVGGHIGFGETLDLALQREAREEAGLEGFRARLVARYVWETEIERELVFMFVTDTAQEPVVNTSEVDQGRFWTAGDVRDGLGKGLFTPNFEREFVALQRAGLLFL